MRSGRLMRRCPRPGSPEKSDDEDVFDVLAAGGDQCCSMDRSDE
jgi:hypothetical protein